MPSTSKTSTKTSTKTAITPTRVENFPEWYQQVIKSAQLAENSETRGCMVIRPWGYALWEGIQKELDFRFKQVGVENAYFPLLIPLSFLEKEAEHADGFATECAVVTHHRLEAQKQEDGSTKMIPRGELTEPYVIRPTSETIIGSAFSRWIDSYRDLPLRVNQWANVMRWEMRPRLFLRTAEFLWQEGHTAHETEEDAVNQTRQMHQIYADFLREYLAVPLVMGEKTEAERFPGAEQTHTVEVMVQDKKAIQAGTSHYLGQNFSKAQEICFMGRDGASHYAHTTSWGVSTRLIGTLIMMHSDDDGLVLPPRIAPQQVVIIPVTPKEETKEAVIDAAHALAEALRREVRFHHETIRVHVDDRDLGGGVKKWEWVKKGVPIRVEIGPKDIQKRTVCVQRRDQPAQEKNFVQKEAFLRSVAEELSEIQAHLLERAEEFRAQNIQYCQDLVEFSNHWTDSQPGWLLTPWAGSREQEEELAKQHKITIRCLPENASQLVPDLPSEGACLVTQKMTKQMAIWGRSY